MVAVSLTAGHKRATADRQPDSDGCISCDVTVFPINRCLQRVVTAMFAHQRPNHLVQPVHPITIGMAIVNKQLLALQWLSLRMPRYGADPMRKEN